MAIAYFSTWTTYGTWLPGDSRGWYRRGAGFQDADPTRRFDALVTMMETAVVLDPDQRRLVERTVADHCAIRNWFLHAVNCRTNHVHVVVTAPGRPIGLPREQFKSWCTRRLKERERPGPEAARENWWTERGWDEYIDDETALADVIGYVHDGQDSR